MASIDEQGGAVAAIESGFIQNQIADAAYAYQMDVERSESIIVGVNQYKADETVKIKLQDIDPKLELDQKERLKNYKAQRESKALKSATNALAQAAGSDANLMPFILAGLKSKLTLGEICKTLRSAFGDYRSA